jgi:hypothetical protein
MVVHHVEKDGQSARVSRIDKPLQVLRRSVRMMRRVQVNSVIAPSPFPGELVNRHQFEVSDAEFGQVVQPLDCRQIRSLWRERTDMHFIDHRGRQRPGLPVRIAPPELLMIHEG